MSILLTLWIKLLLNRGLYNEISNIRWIFVNELGIGTMVDP